MLARTAQIIDGVAVAAKIRGECRGRIDALKAKGVVPGLAVIVVGQDPASAVYVRNKIRACQEVGIQSFRYDFDASASPSAVLDLIAEWSGILTEPYAAARMTHMKADLNETYFAWSGPTNTEAGTNITAYYRVQGPHLVIEYAPQSDEPGNHVHTMYRDPTNDYGIKLTGAQ